MSQPAYQRGDAPGDCKLLVLTSDQGSPIFASYTHLAFTSGLRMAWFPDANHQEANIEKHILPASGMLQVLDKTQFLMRLNNGPLRGQGHWFRQQQEAHKAIPVAVCLFGIRGYLMCHTMR